MKTLDTEVYRRGDVPVECDVSCKSLDWNNLEMLECAVSGYCVFEEPYLGPCKLQESVTPKIIDGVKGYPCRYLVRRVLPMKNVAICHKHERNSFYPAIGDVTVEQVVLECGEWCFVGNRLRFNHMRHCEWNGPECAHEPISAAAWADKPVRVMEDGSVEAEIYIVRDFHQSKLKLFCAMLEWPQLEFGRICHVFMGEDENIILSWIKELRNF